jgi:hypothetical protein
MRILHPTIYLSGDRGVHRYLYERETPGEATARSSESSRVHPDTELATIGQPGIQLLPEETESRA